MPPLMSVKPLSNLSREATHEPQAAEVGEGTPPGPRRLQRRHQLLSRVQRLVIHRDRFGQLMAMIAAV
jgi:hypothetical protein